MPLNTISAQVQAAVPDSVAPPSPARKPRYQTLQAGRGFAALLVVLHHSALLLERSVWHRADFSKLTMGGALGVPFFFVLSGIVILMMHWNDLGVPRGLPIYVWKRVRRVYPIYWIVLTLTLLSHPSTTLHRPFLGIVSAYTLIHIRPEDILGVNWTLYHEIMFYALFATAWFNKWLGTAVLGLWWIVSCITLVTGTTSHFSFTTPLHLLFAMGMIGAWMIRTRRTPSPRILLICGSLIFACGLVMGMRFPEIPDWLHLVGGFGSLLALVGAAELECQGRLTIPRWAIFLGDASYSIYLIHYGVISKLCDVFFRFNAHHPLPLVIWLIALFIAGSVAGCLLHIWVERPLLKWMGKLPFFQGSSRTSNRDQRLVTAKMVGKAAQVCEPANPAGRQG